MALSRCTRTQAVQKAARGMQLTFHRAFDVTSDYVAAFEDVVNIGCDRLLTSGCASSAVEGQCVLQHLVKLANRQIAIVAAAGLSAANVGPLRSRTGVQGVHAGSAVTTFVCTNQNHEQIKMGKSQHGTVNTYPRVNATQVRQFRVATLSCSMNEPIAVGQQ